MLSAGRTFGRYLIVREIGRGGMGAVFEARHQQLHKRVALKTLHSAALDPRSIERFLREGRAAASLAHPHVVDVWDVGVEDGTPFIVMELLDGEDLAARIGRDAPLSVEATIDVALPVLAAVAAMHDKGVVHRDLKPENIFLAKGLGGQDVPKVLDFGVCLGVESDARRLTDGGIVGTPDYLSPEQVEGASGDPKSDQHALGVILFEALTARRPYRPPRCSGCSRRSATGEGRRCASCARTSLRASPSPSSARSTWTRRVASKTFAPSPGRCSSTAATRGARSGARSSHWRPRARRPRPRRRA
jgi:serine/threonine-protein kinase